MKIENTDRHGNVQQALWVRSLDVLDASNHDPSCSGCPICSESARQTLRTMSALDDGPPAPPDLAEALRAHRSRGSTSQYASDPYGVATRTIETAMRTAVDSGFAASLSHSDFVAAITHTDTNHCTRFGKLFILTTRKVASR